MFALIAFALLVFTILVVRSKKYRANATRITSFDGVVHRGQRIDERVVEGMRVNRLIRKRTRFFVTVAIVVALLLFAQVLSIAGII